MSQTQSPAHPSMDGGAEFSFWRDHTHISLQPVAPPSVLGLFGFAGATFIVATNLAGWYGNSTTPTFLFPFAAMFGGLAQLLAGMWGYRARDAIATSMHGAWGAFWLGYGILYLLVATHVLVPPVPFVALGYWFAALAAITWSGAIAALAQNISISLVLIALAAGATCQAVGQIADSSAWRTTGAYLFIASAVLGWYAATALLFEAAFRRVVLPVGRVGGVNRPGRPPRNPIQYMSGEPGVKVGQ